MHAPSSVRAPACVWARLGADQSGQTALEYALIGALTSIAIIAGLTLLGSSVNQQWNWVSNVVKTATTY